MPLTLISTDTFKPLTVGINIFNGYNMIEWQYLFAASLYAIVPVVILFVGIEKNLVGGLTSGGVKVDFYFFPSIIEEDADARKGCPRQPFVHAP